MAEEDPTVDVNEKSGHAQTPTRHKEQGLFVRAVCFQGEIN